MKNVTLIGAGSDLGVHINGASLGPTYILNNFKEKKILLKQSDNILKSTSSSDLKKNLKEVNLFNKKLYDLIKLENNFCITIGGDHSISIASGLASLSKNPNLGIIWIDAHLDYNTFDTTITGNLHGLPLATLNGLNNDLSNYHFGNYFNPLKTVVIGYRALEANQQAELANIKKMGVTVYTTDDIKKYGVDYILKDAFSKADCFHISFDLDVIDPKIASGVSVFEANGLDLSIVKDIFTNLKSKKDLIKSFDIVEYNPLNDLNNQTLKIAVKLIQEVITF